MALFSKDPGTSKPAQGSNSDRSGATGAAFIGRNIIIEGKVSGEENMVIEGTVRGEIALMSDVRVGPNAKIEAKVHAKNVVIEGTVHGDVSADQRVELVAGANVEGNIKAPKIVVAEGAKFRGSVDMGSVKPSDDTNKPNLEKVK